MGNLRVISPGCIPEGGIYVTEKASSVEQKTRVVETLTIERQPAIKIEAIN
jgi:hypothetical protein